MRVLVKSFCVKWMAVWGCSAYKILAPMILWCPQVLLRWLQDPHITPTSCSESRAPPPFSHCHISSPYLMDPWADEWSRDCKACEVRGSAGPPGSQGCSWRGVYIVG